MIDIEKEILAMSEEAKDLPETMNMDRIRRRAKKRKRIHTIGVIGKSLAGVLVTMFLAGHRNAEQESGRTVRY